MRHIQFSEKNSLHRFSNAIIWGVNAYFEDLMIAKVFKDCRIIALDINDKKSNKILKMNCENIYIYYIYVYVYIYVHIICIYALLTCTGLGGVLVGHELVTRSAAKFSSIFLCI